MAICIWTLLEELWDALGSWADNDANNAESSISPAGELYFDDRALNADNSSSRANRSQDIGTIGAGDYTVYMRFKGDVWDGQENTDHDGIRLLVDGASQRLQFFIAQNADGAGSNGIWLDNGAGFVKVVIKSWDNNFHTIRLDVHNSQTDVDIYIDGVLAATDADCSDEIGTDGLVILSGYGSQAGNGEYHIDFLKINSGNCDPDEVAGGALLGLIV